MAVAAMAAWPTATGLIETGNRARTRRVWRHLLHGTVHEEFSGCTGCSLKSASTEVPGSHRGTGSMVSN
jgi:hypothetical protein